MTHDQMEEKLKQARELNTTREYAEALDKANEVLSVVDTLKKDAVQGSDLILQVRALVISSESLRRLCSFDESLLRAQSALTITEKSPETMELRARVFRTVGNAHQARCEFTQALDFFRRELAEREERHDKSGIAAALHNLCYAYQGLSDFTLAVQCLNRALAINEELGARQEVAGNLSNLGLLYDHLSDFPKASECFKKSLEIDEDMGNKYGVAINLGNLGIIHKNTADYPGALEYYAKALAINEEFGYRAELADNLSNMAHVYANLADYPLALEYYRKSLAINEELGKKSQVASNLLGIGTLHQELGDLQTALAYFRQSMALYSEVGNKFGIAVLQGNIGSIHHDLNEQELALEFMLSAVHGSELLDDQRQVGIWTQALGSIHRSLGNSEIAMECLQKSLHILRDELHSNEGVSNVLIEIGALLADAKKFDEAIEYLNEGLACAERLGEKLHQYTAQQELAKAHAAMGHYERAYEHHQEFHRIKEEVQSEEAKNKARMFEYERRKTEEEKRLAQEKAEEEKRVGIERAHAKATEQILHKVLPPTIATRLIKGEKIADYFPLVSVLFADIVGFTPIAAHMPARAVFALLNHVFAQFDRIMESHSCEKIKTIGDGYMAISGAPVECADHAERLARAAVEMMTTVVLDDDIRASMPDGTVLELRIGLHCGSAFAGIVGDQRFIYDVYSDTVNTASRMESQGQRGKIHCSEEFAHHLQNRDESFRFLKRSEMEIKGKGMMRTYFLESA